MEKYNKVNIKDVPKEDRNKEIRDRLSLVMSQPESILAFGLFGITIGLIYYLNKITVFGA